MELMQQQTARFYEFGPFLVDPVKCVLMRGNEILPLSPKAFEILLLLIKHRGQVLEKDDLLKQVWPDTVVEENNLARHISALRKVFDEHPGQHQYILTIPGRGYRFVASVRELDDVDERVLAQRAVANGHAADEANTPEIGQLISTETVSTAKRPTSKIKLTNRMLIVGLALVVAALAIRVFLLGKKTAVSRPSPPRKLWQLTYDAGLESEPSFSPDGRMIAYSSDRSGNFDIWVQPIGQGNAVRVTASPSHDWQPDWAPDGNLLVFRSERDHGGLFIVPVLGGIERKISSFGYRPRWSPDGTQILFYSSIVQINTIEIPKVYLVGLEEEPPHEILSEFLTEFDTLRVAWHPDGKRVSVWGNHRKQGWSFWTVPVDGGAPIKSEVAETVKQQLKESDVSFTDFQWSHSGGTLYFEGVSRSVRNIWRVNVDPQSLAWIAGPERLTNGSPLDTDLALSSDGTKLAFTARNERTRLWSLPFDGVDGKVKDGGQPITSAGVDALRPDISHDGKKLVFVAQRAGKEELWEKSLSDGHETLLVADDSSRIFPRWSHDGLRLSYARLRPPNSKRAQNECELTLISANGGDEQTITTTNNTPELAWDWSSDGEWILGGSQRQTPGRRLICLFPLVAAPHAETEMRVIASHPENNLWQARFSPDNRWISFCAAKADEAGVSTIYVVPASGGAWIRITEGKYFDDKPRWSPDGKTIYFISSRTGFFNVWGLRFDPNSGKPAGEPFRVTSFENPSQMILSNVRYMDMALAANRLVLPIMEVSGGIWILENP
jgi:Tol biopolymer transport system component/DNA-binding winged helix-turn-helix (wHTH) protein